MQIYRTGNMTSGMRLQPMDLLKADIIDHVPAQQQEAITAKWEVELSFLSCCRPFYAVPQCVALLCPEIRL